MTTQQAFLFLELLNKSFDALDLPFRVLSIAVPHGVCDKDLNTLIELVHDWKETAGLELETINLSMHGYDRN